MRPSQFLDDRNPKPRRSNRRGSQGAATWRKAQKVHSNPLSPDRETGEQNGSSTSQPASADERPIATGCRVTCQAPLTARSANLRGPGRPPPNLASLQYALSSPATSLSSGTTHKGTMWPSRVRAITTASSTTPIHRETNMHCFRGPLIPGRLALRHPPRSTALYRRGLAATPSTAAPRQACCP
jgi:hypothetical protein